MGLGPFSLPSFHKLPSKSDALELVLDTFRSFNSFYPLFDEQDFLERFHENYSRTSPTSPGWWAILNVVLSLGHRFRAMRMLDPVHANSESCGFVHNALAVVSGLNVLEYSLPAIQALVGMAIVLQGTPNPHTASVLIAAAMRLAQTMGLHRSTHYARFPPAEAEQRKRVFWVAYFLDRDISLRMGTPFTQSDDDMDTELPSGNPSELPWCRDETQTINFFNSRVGLAVIQGQVYRKLYSVQATRLPAAQRAAVALELNSILSFWRDSVPLDLEELSEVSAQKYLSIESLHMFILRFVYVHCLAMVDRHLPSMQQLPFEVGMDDTFQPVESICIVESRKAVRLIQLTPRGDYACVW